MWWARKRWPLDVHEVRPVSPGEFIPLLEQSGLIIPFGRWVFREAAAQCKAWTKSLP